MVRLQKIRVFFITLFPGLFVAVLPTIATGIAQEKPFQQEVVRLTAKDGHAVAGLMTFPEEGMNVNAPAVIHIQGGPGATPLEGSGPWIAEGLASGGYTVVAPMVRHADKLLTASFAEFNLDIEAAVDFLSSLGFRNIILAGSSYGSICTTRYIVDTQDSRIKANLHFAPTADMGPRTRRGMGDETYWKTIAEAGRLVSEGKGRETVFAPIFEAPPPAPKGNRARFTYVAQVWLEMRGPASLGNNSALFPQIRQPMLLLLGDQDGINTKEDIERLKATATASSRVDFFCYDGGVNHSLYPIHQRVVEDVVKWLDGIGLGPKPRVKTEVVTINEGTMGIGMQRGFQYAPASGAKQKGTAFVLLHDWKDDAFKGPSQWLGPALAQAGYTAVSINAIRGVSQTMRNKFEMSDGAIKDWIDYLQHQGFSSVILVGHGFGGNRTTHYLLSTQDERVRGLAYVAPPPDSAAWLREGMGPEKYAKAIGDAEELLKHNASEELMQFTIFQPPPAPAGKEAFKLLMLPDAFLSTWGPQAPALSEQIRKVRVPVLLLGGSKDMFITEAAFNQLTRNAQRVEVKWYGGNSGADHVFTGYESRVANDILSWITK